MTGAGAVPYYARGRLPYASGLADMLARALDLDGHGRLLDVGCGPGIVALRLAPLFDEVVGVDIDPDMLAEAERRAKEQGVTHPRWLHARAEELPASLGPFRVATFGRSFHWMNHERLAPKLYELLQPGGALVVLLETGEEPGEPAPTLSHPSPPRAAIEALLAEYLPRGERRSGGDRRAALLRDVPPVLTRAGFAGPDHVRAEGGDELVRSADDVVAFYFSHSHSTPPLLGGRVAEFEARLRRMLAEASPSGMFSERSRAVVASIWHRSPRPREA